MIEPKIKTTEAPFASKTCIKCGKPRPALQFIKLKSEFFPDGYSNTCNMCIREFLQRNEFSWDAVDKLCRHYDVPFVPTEFERLHQQNGDNVFPIYSQVFLASQYDKLDWRVYFEEFKKLKAENKIRDELPLLDEQRRRELQTKWGHNYSDDELDYLENLYQGLLLTQNINGALQVDQALKICKISLELDSKIREGADFDKILASYEKLVKTAEFTPKNVKNASDFDSVGELVLWLEKGGWKNQFFDNVTKDIVDETIKNIQSYNQRLYVNENGIGEEISRRIDALNTVEQSTDYYNVSQEFDIDEFDAEGFKDLMSDDFNPDVEEVNV